VRVSGVSPHVFVARDSVGGRAQCKSPCMFVLCHPPSNSEDRCEVDVLAVCAPEHHGEGM